MVKWISKNLPSLSICIDKTGKSRIGEQITSAKNCKIRKRARRITEKSPLIDSKSKVILY